MKITRALILFTLSFAAMQTHAQKLPKIQEAGLRIPKNLKVDGKATEWKNKFEAYNNNTAVFYTLANDDNQLYLVVQATDPLVIRKIIAGGVTFKINPADKSAEAVSVTYPLFSSKNWPAINLKDKPEVTKDSSVKSAQVDSFKRAINQRLNDQSKEIKVFGVKTLGDTLISVYNQDGIKAASLFDSRIAYTYELAIPLKYLGLSGSTQFSYTIALNGSSFAEGTTIEDIEGGTRLVWNGKAGVTMGDMQFIRFPTSCSGVYTLAKK
ncbi:MAG: hypothetical protein V4592_07040 [Bacteroidota bacterium]